ncbi:uncharacterized protein LOC129808500 [Phlebotomus papatasi]|uniref:uncharacterized protein LOC129808500 n=1 Tax=Phlebotomus papatasi TaxID=29031 RepID=UPI0024840D8D|nr:uncharacterized protein LOC129808500 [Phlebotomus papatasi]
MYRQIRVHEEDQSMQRILWRESSQESIKTYLLETVTYGTACAPFLAVRCLQQLSVEEEQKFPLAAVTAQRDFYVDDVLTGSSDVTTAQELQQQLHNMLQSGGFMLKKWASNSTEALEHVPVEDQETSSSLDLDSEGTIKTLGMHWNPFTDEFRFTTTEFNSTITKRSILSDIARIYDPLGILAAVTISAKILLQSLWKVKMDWDTELSSGIQKKWQQYQVNIYSVVTQITIPRQFTSFQSVSDVQLIAFCAASEEAFAASVYVCTVDNQGQRCSRLLCAKTKVAPLKEVSNSRLQLCSAVLLANLLKKVQSALTVQVSDILAFTSSMLVLNWVSEDPSMWQTFVKNRVTVIQSVVSSSQWHFVAPRENPAELAARGVPASELTEYSIWWQGPTWLANSEINPQPVEFAQVNLEELEMRSSVVLVSAQNSFWEITSHFSSYLKLIRCIAYWRRYVRNLHAKCRKIDGISGRLSPREVKEAETTLLRHIQAESYPEELKSLYSGNSVSRQSRILNLNPFIDNNGIMRVGGRISHASVSYEQKFPIILPQSHRVTEMIVREIHQDLLHGGAQLMLAHLRQSFWPVRGLDVCKRIIRQCVTCFKVKPVPMTHIMSDCHPSRVTAVHAFHQTGVDFCEPVYIRAPVRSKTRLKMYIALYICLSTRAIHIELVSDLTTDAFIASLKRFVSRRGKPAEILCDNATNFVGAARELKEMAKLVESEEHQRQVTDSASKQGINFKFIPPRSPHFGGSRESIIKRIKYHLQRTVGNSHLTQEEMLTVLARIESCVNSRPLTPISSDPTDMEVLTPGHFLIGRPLTALPEQNLLEIPEGRLKKWKLVDQRIQHFWHRWTSEYLHTLQQRRKWTSQHSPIAIGNMVIIKEDNLPPLKWHMGRVVQIYPGADGVPRVATVRTAYGTYKRAVAKLCILPFTQ